MKNRILIAIFLGLTFFTLPTMAQTPDAETPANEAVCDDLIADGVTPGLYGLCVAFCEAQDIAAIEDSITKGDLDALLASAPDGRILENYNKRKSESDPDMPCVRVEEPCPCWSEAELAEIDGVMWHGGPSQSPMPYEPGGRSCYYFSSTSERIEAYEIDYRAGAKTSALTQGSAHFNMCSFYRHRNGPDGSSTAILLVTPDITDEQQSACAESLRNFQAYSGFCPEGQP